ncbi:hypothetical protein [Lactococcus formosensis]|uniref:hypothetical protein n=1 Tax=Lactococcus formosensis TaxID=1281486 RepID=UPI002549E62B|nr:hypothetical protein [Lactococcus formosensis]
MIELLQTLLKMFQEVHDESYLEVNTSKEITYPYVTYSLDIDNIDKNTDGFYLDIDIFDNDSSYIKIYDLEDRLREKFDFTLKFTDGLFLRSYFKSSTHVPTLSNTLKRRTMQIYCKVDWRNK